jgi:hypothetical protein
VDTFERPADTSVGVPLVPIIVARIKSRGVQSAKAAEVDVLVADYGMMATASDVDKAAIAEAQTSFDKLPGPKPIFPENTKDSK